MPLLGEVPITSFFKPNTDSKKRKSKTGYAPSLKKRRNEHSEAPKNDLKVTQSFKGKKKGTTTVTNGPHINEGPSRMSSVVQRARIPNTPTLMVSHKETEHEVLPYFKSPMTNEASFQNRKPTDSGSDLSHPILTSQGLEIVRKPVAFLPTTVTMKCQSSRQLAGPSRYIEETPSKSITGVEIITPTMPTLEAMGSNVPSSQSQNILAFIPKALSLSTRSALVEQFLVPLPRFGNSTLAPSQREEPDLEILAGKGCKGAQLIVDSSQSQVFDNFNEEPQRSRAIHRSGPTEEDPLVVIPSSQSQENDLIPPHPEVKTRFQEEETQPRFSPLRTKIATSQISRTLSDEILPIPFPHSLLSDIFQQEDEPLEDLKPLSNFAEPAENFNDLSATESESESEAVGTGNQFTTSVIHNAIVRPLRLPRGSPHHLTTHDNSQGSESLPSQFTSSTVASPESSYTSLPPAIREFRNMFGSNDESYPPDFPMSLR